MTNASSTVEGASNLLERRRQVFQKSYPSSGWCDALGCSSKQLQLEPLLKPSDRVAQGRLRYTELYRSPREASFIGYDCKCSELVQFIFHDL